MWPSTLSGRLRIVALVSRYPTNQLMRRGLLHLRCICTFPSEQMPARCLSGISTRFQALFRSVGQITHVLLTRPPLTPKGPLDLHVLGTPPAFVLSQDQTLKKVCLAHSTSVDYVTLSLSCVFSFQGTNIAFRFTTCLSFGGSNILPHIRSKRLLDVVGLYRVNVEKSLM